MRFAIVGAGFTGAVLAYELAKAGHNIQVFESRNHIAGNCYSERDKQSGIMLHKYGPHIFHTDNEQTWNYINQFSEFMPYINRVKITSQGRVFSLPINLHTINQYFNKTFNPTEAKIFIQSIIDSSTEKPESFEQQAIKLVGEELYKAFLKGYTIKQWGISPTELPASILQRLPIRFNYDDNYFNHTYQGIPKNGYTVIVERMLTHSNIKLYINKKVNKSDVKSFDHVFYTGSIDSWFDYAYGRLGYRTLDFIREEYNGDFQGCAVMNYGDEEIPYTRISEHKYFSPWESHEKTVIFKEYSRECGEDDIPCYPIRLAHDKEILKQYIKNAKKEKNVSFLGRLGTYRYLDMDVTVSEALSATCTVLSNINNIPVFFHDLDGAL